MNQFPRKKGFTLVEVIIVCVIFATIMVGIILAINRAYVFLNNTRMSVRATNLAREGVEMVYNLRDTNRRKYSGKKDQRWLKAIANDCDIGTSCPYFGNSVAPDTNTFYYLKEEKTSYGDTYFFASPVTVTDNDKFYSIDGFFSDNIRKDFKIDFTGTYSYYSGGTIATGNVKDLLEGPGIEFYRVLRLYGIYKKNTTNPNEICAGNCLTDGTPAEMRFCVKVFYTYNGGKHATELCSIMTNFME